jgi:hypothetical protein
MNTSIAQQLAELTPALQLSSDEHAFSEHSCTWDNLGLTVQDEPFDLASEIEPSIWDAYMPNDGTSRVEHRLRRQGLRKASDSTREPAQELIIECMKNRRTTRLHIIRQNGGEVYINQSELGTYDALRHAMLERDIALDVARNPKGE